STIKFNGILRTLIKLVQHKPSRAADKSLIIKEKFKNFIEKCQEKMF
ncbi:hypothetical protein DOY81_009242, partial [Sarcophaga bullata]